MTGLSRAVRRRARGDGGAGTVETLGIVSVAALLVGAVMVGVSTYPSHVSAAFCRFATAIGLDAGSCAVAPPTAQPEDVPTDEDYQPPVCMLRETSEQYSAETKIWFLSFGENSGFIVQEFSDGTVRATMTDGASIGANGALGSGTFDAGKLGDGDNAGYEIDLGADLKFSYGDTWEFESKEQWEEMEEQLDEYLMQQEMMKHEGGFWAIKGSGGFVDPPIERQISFSRVDLEVALNASVGLREPTGGVGEDGAPEFFDPNVGANLALSASGGVILETNHETGEQSWTYEVSGRAEAGANVVVGGGQVQGEVTGAFQVTRDEDNELTQVTFASTYETGVQGGLGNDASFDVGGGYERSESDSVVTTTTLDVTDDNRDLVEEWLSHTSGGGEALKLPFGAMVPENPSDDPFLQLLYEEARTSEVEYHNITDRLAFEAAIKKGWEFGFSISAEEATATMTDAHFLGAPGTSGTRPMVPDLECTD